MASNMDTAAKTGLPGSDCRRDWKEILAQSIVSIDALAGYFKIDSAALKKVAGIYPVRINPYFMSLIQKKDDPIYKQAVPDLKELENGSYSEDPLFEERQSPVPNLIHRYPGRVLFMASNQCAMYCRYCMRKRKTGHSHPVRHKIMKDALSYIRANKAISEVILSGGDPLLLDDEVIHWILSRLQAMAHVDLIRIHTRVPSALPQRITGGLVEILKKFHPLYINVHFNHPAEITETAAGACRRLADAGIPLGSQTVLLKGINDNPAVLKELFLHLVKLRVRPYYLHQGDLVKGTAHFRTSLQTGLEILNCLRGSLAGFCIPQYVIDLPGGCGKIPLQAEHASVAAGARPSGIQDLLQPRKMGPALRADKL